MKKIFAILALAVMLMVPVSAMALSTVSDSDLSTITGQSGVSINLDVNLNITSDVVAWGDSDGITNIQGYGNTQGDEIYNNAGFIGLNQLTITNLHLRMRAFAGFLTGETMMTDSQWDTLNQFLINNATDTTGANQVGTVVYAFSTHNAYSKALTIDVGTNAAGTKTIVSIGVPSMVITMDSMTANVALFAGNSTASNNPNKITNGALYSAPQTMGNLNVSSLTVLLWGGRVDLSAESSTNAGVSIELKNVQIESIKAHGISWGDPDGTLGTGWTTNTYLQAFDQAGFIGIGSNQSLIQNMVINGQVTIDVGSVNVNTLNALWTLGGGTHAAWVATLMGAGADSQKQMIYGMKKILGTPAITNDFVSYVHIGLNNFNVYIEQMYLPVMLGDTIDLLSGGASHELGIIYAHGMNIAVQTGSWVDILAH